MRRVIVLIFLLQTAVALEAQKVALKTNVLSDGLMNINAGVGVGLSPRLTLDVIGEFNAWSLSHDRRWKHWSVQPGVRYWLCDRFSGHFVGAHLHGGQFNIGGIKNGISFLGTDFSKLSDARFQGWFVGGGVSYGYAWILDKHWNIEAELGLGYSFTRYDRFKCAGCGRKVEADKSHHYVGPTKAAVNIVYMF